MVTFLGIYFSPFTVAQHPTVTPVSIGVYLVHTNLVSRYIREVLPKYLPK